MTPIFVLAFIGIIKHCEAPAVSLSFSSKSKSGVNASSVFSFRNGSWVAVNNPPQTSKGLNNLNSKFNKDSKNGELKSSLTSDVEDLFRKINRTIPLKLLPSPMSEAPGLVTKKVNIARVGSTEKTLGDLFLDWLSKQEEAKPVAAKSPSTVPVLGLQIDFGEGRTQRSVMNCDMGECKVSFREGPIYMRGFPKAMAQPREFVRQVRSHVKKRHPQRLCRALSEEEHDRKTLDSMKQSTVGADTEEFHSGQLLVHNELNNDKKHKVNDLPKYVMKFLSQCKALIEQNYDDEIEQGAKDNFDENDSLLKPENDEKLKNKPYRKSHGNINNETNMATEPGVTHSTYYNDGFNGEDVFESLRINKRPRGKVSKIERDDTSSTAKPNQYEADDSYDDAFDEDPPDWRLDQNLDPPPSNESESKVTKQAYFSSQTNVSCRPILEEFTPERETYTADCSTVDSDFTTLSPMQWKVLMDFLNERMPSSCSPKSTCSRASCTTSGTTPCSRSTCTKIACTKTTSTKPACTKTACTKTACTKTMCTSRSTCTTSMNGSVPSCSSQCVGSSRTTTESCTVPSNECAAHTSPSTYEDSEDELLGPANISIKQSNAKTGKSPQRYLIKIETSKPKRFHDGIVQGRKPSNWFENIRNLKLLEGLKSPSPNTVKSVYYNLHPGLHESPLQTAANNDNEDYNTEKMIAEGVIPLKTGSTLNLYISYVLNKTKARRNKLPLLAHERYSHLKPNPVTDRSCDVIEEAEKR